ncbi:MAG: hypothetical protein H0T79_22800 [Deltaproteobacteria bacterium]|nr:hypothetical protein [Deltaproteobacteria bacterium]
MKPTNLRAKLCRELVQSELDAVIHTAHEARRLGDAPPAEVMRMISEHARVVHPRLLELAGDQPIGVAMGYAVGALFSFVRQIAIDRIIRVERSYRGTVLGLKHGVDVARMLQRVAIEDGELDLARWCERVIAERQWLIECAESTFGWFVGHREVATRSGLALTFRGIAAEPAQFDQA